MRSVGAIGTTAAEQHETVYRVHSETQLVQLQSNFAQNHIACQEHMKACAVWTISGTKGECETERQQLLVAAASKVAYLGRDSEVKTKKTR